MRSTPPAALFGAAFALLLFLASPAAAQQGRLSGTVTNAETGAPVGQAQVEVLGSGVSTGALSNAQGQYTVQIPAGTYSVVVNYIGYRPDRIDGVEVSAGQTTTLDLALVSQAVALEPISITVGRSRDGEKATEAPATIHSVSAAEITERPTPNPADHLREAPGVDIITSGLQSTNVVVRGFNNIFSGGLHMLTDHRLAGVPSLRVNLMHFIPAVDEDIERMEVVLGPGSALYGPNTANGVLHILTKSPLDDQGTSVTVGAGERSVFQASARSSFLLAPNFGFKISGQYMEGDEWEYTDPTEAAARASADANPTACLTDKAVRGLTSAEGQTACSRLGVRDFDIARWNVQARADYSFAGDGLLVGTYGRNVSSGVELTGLGAGQVNDWTYEFYQGRVSKGRFFAQAYYNTSDAGENSYLLRDGVSLVDQSTLFVGQVQHGIAVADGRQEFTAGFDYFATRPNSLGTIYGSYESMDDIDEWGVYLQSKTALTPQLDFVAAGRMDSHSVLPENVWSPRAALVFQATETQSIRASYNRAFSTPTALNHFLDISGGVAPAPIGALGYSLRAYGTGPDGWSLQNADGTLRGMRSPFNPGGADQLLPADVPVMWQLAIGVLQAQGAIDPTTAGMLASMNPSNADIARMLLDPTSQALTPVAGATLPEVPPLLESYTETYEVGWTGVIANRLSITADVYYMKKNDFGSPLLVQTPLLTMNGTDIATYLVTQGFPAGNAQAIAAGMAQIPLGVVSSDQVPAQGADLLVTYRNVGDIDIWGGDIAFEAFLDDRWSITGSYSRVSDDYFAIEGGAPIALNAPKDKGSLGLAYRDVVRRLNLSGRARFSGGFPAESAGYVGTECITGGTGGIFEEGCVAAFAIFDISAGWQVPNTNATLQLSVTNLLDTPYRSFVGVPKIGRFAMVRVKYDLF